ncbi:MAG: hypothetical protein MO852_17430, partial [Candidatus Devosia euplotis]|nr:hypothetical protein [Candidatus Devosia euplotis]
MNKKAFIIALVSAIAGVAMLQIYMVRFEQEVAGGDPVRVLVTTVDVRSDSVLTESMVGVREIPERFVEQRHILASDRAKVV